MHDCGHEHEETADGADAAGTDGCAIDREVPGPDEGRRAFLRDGLLAVAAITLVAGAAAPLEAMTRRYATGIASGASSTGALATVTYPVPTADGATIDRANRIILVRYKGMIHAFSVECPHKGTVVTWEPENNRFYCPKHKSTFQPEGTRIQGKAPRSLDRYAVRIEGGKVVVDTGVAIDSEATASAWAAAGVKAP